jgi:hypothetical protein
MWWLRKKHQPVSQIKPWSHNPQLPNYPCTFHTRKTFREDDGSQWISVCKATINFMPRMEKKLKKTVLLR